MLEFQEGFFEQEVRDGFYLDVTIKTLWAAEVELLNKVGEVCNKYGLQWYAAYGTLLGAIRHEGFVPWDDDMDIWMMRKDYNKLMKVLQDELPQGYRVRSPLTEEGYEQYHTCVNNGSGISIEKKWLEENHNCPFTVGLDIFPLDYLPRNKKDRELQASIFTLIGRIAQIAKNIGRGDYDNDNSDMTRMEAVEQVKEGLKYLKKNYKFTLDMKWIKNDEWDKVTSEVWKWGNYVASMYGESESDYIVEYMDWMRWEWKKFPKKWFAETYSADFESVMLPIPCGYDQILKTIYADYKYFLPKTGTHEYPFYARQLRQLREYVKNVEQKAENVGLIAIEEVMITDNHDIPDMWVPYTINSKGQKKKIILMANNTDVFIANPKDALVHLENVINYFKTVRENVLLWWRPNPRMMKILGGVDKECEERYRLLLENYQREEWGICDYSDDIECAVNACDAYYGEMNAIVQRVQNWPRPVMLSQEYIEEYAQKCNERRIIENRAYLSYTDYIEVDGKLYFSNSTYNAFVIVDEESGEVKEISQFEGLPITANNIHMRSILFNDQIIFLPARYGYAHVYDIKEKTIKGIKAIENSKDSIENFYEPFVCDGELFIVPTYDMNCLLKWDDEKKEFIKQDWWTIPQKEKVLRYVKIDSSRFGLLVFNSGNLYVVDVNKKSISTIDMPADNIVDITFDGTRYWFTKYESNDIVCWNPNNNQSTIISDIECEYYYMRSRSPFLRIKHVCGKIIVVSQDGNEVFVINPDDCKVEIDKQLSEMDSVFRNVDKFPYLHDVGGRLIYLTRNVNRRIEIDFEHEEITEKNISYIMNKNAIDYQHKVLSKRNALMMETSDYSLKDFCMSI